MFSLIHSYSPCRLARESLIISQSILSAIVCPWYKIASAYCCSSQITTSSRAQCMWYAIVPSCGQSNRGHPQGLVVVYSFLSFPLGVPWCFPLKYTSLECKLSMAILQSRVTTAMELLISSYIARATDVVLAATSALPICFCPFSTVLIIASALCTKHVCQPVANIFGVGPIYVLGLPILQCLIQVHTPVSLLAT